MSRHFEIGSEGSAWDREIFLTSFRERDSAVLSDAPTPDDFIMADGAYPVRLFQQSTESEVTHAAFICVTGCESGLESPSPHRGQVQ